MAVTETRTLPPKYVEDLGKDYSTQLTGLTSQKMDTTKFQPMVAGQDQAQKDAYSMATTQGQGIGSYAPYLQQAGAFQQGTGTFAGQPTNMMGSQDYLQQQGTMSGPNAYQQFMSPYQQDIIDATLSEYDTQAAAGMTGIGQQAAMSGNLGGGREGVMRSQYQNKSDLNRALLQSGLLQQGFTQSNQLANQAFGQQQNLANLQMNLGQAQQGLSQNQQGMASLLPSLYQQDISTLGAAGSGQQAQAQAQLDATREQNRLEAYEPYERLGYQGQGIASIASGAPGQYQSSVTPNPTPLQTALGIASVGGGLMGNYGDYRRGIQTT